MNLPDISVWNAGVQHDEDTFNAVTYALEFLLNPPEAKVIQTSAQSIATGATTATAISWSSKVLDNDGMWNAATPTVLTVQTPGWYEAEWAVAFAGHADLFLRAHGLFVSASSFALGNAIAYNDYEVDNTTATPEMWGSYDLFLNAGDTVAVGVVQTSGSALNTASSSTDATSQTFLRLRWSSL